ncbi:MAG: glycosyl hydrolase [Candidatus Margulisiibacteriota bacterium]|nr:glycosyl hydrolase [Candidatus Margulisiibacteriota bacterium]
MTPQPKGPDILTNFTGCAVGAFVNGMGNISDFQTMIGKNLAVILWYVHWQDPFPTADADTVYNNGSVPLITWEPWITHELGTLEAIAAGSYESYVTQFIQDAKDWGGPVLLRFAHEMNGNWYPWDGYHNGATLEAATKYKNAWIYIYNVKQQLNADNVYLVWTPNNTNLPAESWNEIANYYPGDQYVDWVGMDGYNWGYGNWQEFDAVFSSIYQALIQLTNKPIMVGEFASAEQGGSKSSWIIDAMAKLQSSYQNVKIFCWFNINKERDWRANSSSTSEAAFRQGLQDDYFLDTIRE